MPRLIYNSGSFGSNVFELRPGATVIGRADECEVCILHKSLSRRHARFDAADGQVLVSDLASKNGTFVNGTKIERHELRDGDVLRLGDLVFAFLGDGAAPAPAPGGSSESRPTLVMGLGRSSIEELLGETKGGALRIRHAEGAQRARDKLRVLLEVATLLSSSGNIDALLEKIVELVFRILDVDRASILLVDPRTGRLEPRVSRAPRAPPRAAPEGEGAPIYSQHIVDYVRDSHLAALFSDAALDPRLGAARSVVHQSIKSSMCAPLKPRDEVIGVLYVDNLSIPARFSEEDLEFLVAFANQAAVAIDRSMLQSRLEEAAVAQVRLSMEARLAVLDAVVTGIVQEIKAPLNFIDNFAQLSLELAADLGERLDAERSRLSGGAAVEIHETLAFLRENAAKIDGYARKANQVLAAVLAQAKGRSGRREEASLNALLAESVGVAYERVRHEDPGFELVLDATYDPEIRPAEMVTADLGRAFINVVDNACYAMRKKRRDQGEGYAPRLTVRTARVGGRAEVRIRDNGTGVAKEIADKIFSPFFTTKPPGEGAGLGLSIAYETVVQRHDGEMRMETVPGEHTEIIIVLPERRDPPTA